MNSSFIYALDFDGVICDSAVETAITGWKVATQLWSDMADTVPTEEHINQFRELRPQLETGYEAILLMRLLQQGESVTSIRANISHFLKELGQDTEGLKQLFGQTRDQWIQQAPAEWVMMNPLFDGIANSLAELDGQPWYIITTKQERFVEQILKANQIELPGEHIFGLDKKLSKQAVLSQLLIQHPDIPLRFIEDRLATLTAILNNKNLNKLDLQLVDWGYNTVEEKLIAKEKGITLISLPQFLQD